MRYPDSSLKFKDLPRITQACAVLELARKKLDKVLRKAGPLGVLPRNIIQKAVDEAIWQIDQRVTPVIDDIWNGEFMSDLNDFKQEYKINEEASIFYLGSSNDTSVQRVFPQVVNVDRGMPKRMPRSYRFIQDDASHLPYIESGTVDVAVFKCIGHRILEMSAIAKELERILHADGKVLNVGNISNNAGKVSKIDFFTKPASIQEAVSQNIALRILRNFYTHGLQMTKQFPNGTVLLEKKEAKDGTREIIEEIYARNRGIFYELLIKSEGDKSNTDILTVMPQIENALDLSISECRYMDWEYIEKILKIVKAEAPSEAYKIIEKKIKIFLDWVKKHD